MTTAYVLAVFWISLGHAVLPHHWLPYAAAGRERWWPMTRVLRFALLGLGVHVASTAIAAGMAGLVGYALGDRFGHALGQVGGVLVLGIGLLYLLPRPKAPSKLHRTSWLLAAAAGIEPCTEVIPLLLFSALAGIGSVVTVTAVWLGVTVLTVLTLSALAFRNLQKARWITPQASRRVTAAMLLLSGLLALFLPHGAGG